MSVTKLQRNKKRQMGQFLTPLPLATSIVGTLGFSVDHKVLEPSMGDGSFVLPLIEKFMPLYDGDTQDRLEKVLTRNIWGVELDKELYEACLNKIQERWGRLPKKHNLIQGDFFRVSLPTSGGSLLFDTIVGNPPFGGSFDPLIEDSLDADYGVRDGQKIKKETYAFFIVKSIDLLRRGGTLSFICSDTFLTINTMRGLRAYLMNRGDISIDSLSDFSEETTYPMVVLRYVHTDTPGRLVVRKLNLSHDSIRETANLSFGFKPEFKKYFAGPRMGDFFVATSGMTTGRNEYFVREIKDGEIEESYCFSYYEEPITLEAEFKKARLGKLSSRTVSQIKEQEIRGVTRRAVLIERMKNPKIITIPHEDYRPYNKATNSIIYTAPTHVIYWKNNGEAVLTYKKSGNWYLRGVGGQPYFMREGITWQLIASRMHMSYLPAGYILDSGAPCAFPREKTEKDEIFLALGWALTNQCNKILKEVINHTKNIQGKDFERLPYPFWVTIDKKKRIIALIKDLINRAMKGTHYDYKSAEIDMLNSLFDFPSSASALSFIPIPRKEMTGSLF